MKAKNAQPKLAEVRRIEAIPQPMEGGKTLKFFLSRTGDAPTLLVGYVVTGPNGEPTATFYSGIDREEVRKLLAD